METGVRAQDRRSALAPYLERLGHPEPGPGRPPDGNPEPAIVLGNWEQSVVRAALEAGPEAHRGWETLLAEGVALQSKFLAEVDQLEGAVAPEVEERLKQQILHSAAIGLALSRELQREIDSMVLTGNVAQAKKLTLFRNKVRQLISQIRERVGADGFVLAEALAEEMITAVESAEPKPKPLAERIADREERPHQPIKLDSRHRTGRILHRDARHSRLKPLLIVFGVAVAAWAILILPRGFKPELPELTAQDLSFAPAVREVTARPPSLFLVVDAAAWEGMPAEGREELVRQIGAKAEEAGYSGAHLRLKSGTTVAQWSRLQGVKLVTPARTGT